MALTVVGIFNNQSEAQQAVSQLVEYGMDRNSVDFLPRFQPSGNSGQPFFNALFDDDDASRYMQAANQKSVVTVHVHTEDQAKSASEILDTNGAIALNEQTPVVDSLTKAPSESMAAAFLSDEEMEAARQAAAEAAQQQAAQAGLRQRSQIVSRSIEETHRLR